MTQTPTGLGNLLGTITPGFRGCYETVPSLRDSENFSHCTQHSAFGSVLGYHDSAPTALGSYGLFHRCDNEQSFVTPLPPGANYFRPAGSQLEDKSAGKTDSF